MKTIRVKGLRELERALRKDLQGKQKSWDRARKRAARRHAAFVRQNMPVAFGELRASVHADGTIVVADGPHAAAVERGSRPHWMPLEPLIAWVKLRGFQGLASTKSLSRMPGSTTSAHATRVAGSLQQHNDESGYADWGGGASDMQGPVAVAKAIQVAIALRGTKPQWYMRNSIPTAQQFLREEVSIALSEEG